MTLAKDMRQLMIHAWDTHEYNRCISIIKTRASEGFGTALFAELSSMCQRRLQTEKFQVYEVDVSVSPKLLNRFKNHGFKFVGKQCVVVIVQWGLDPDSHGEIESALSNIEPGMSFRRVC